MSAPKTGTYKAAQVPKAGGKFEVVDKPHRALKPNEVLIKVEACGVCHSDSLTQLGLWPGIDYPRVPGHEVIGVIEALGDLVPSKRGLKEGVRVGRGWAGGHCFACNNCLEGDFVLCESHKVSGITDDGGYAEYMYAPWESLAIVPDSIPSSEAGPLMCAGVTTFNALRNMHKAPPAIVAVVGVGGLGHLAIQFAAKSGYTVVAIGRGQAKADEAKRLGATHYLDNSNHEAAKGLQALGGADVIIATATDSKTTSELIPGLGSRGVILVIGIGKEPIQVNALDLIGGRTSVQGWPSGTAWDSQKTLEFSASQKVKAEVQEFGLADVQKAYDGMMEGSARYRNVIVPGKK